MIPFTTSPDQKVRLYRIASLLNDAGISTRFITDAVKMGEEYEGLFDLLVLWEEEQDEEIRGEILADIQEEIDQAKELPREPEHKPYIMFDDLEEVANDVMSFKNALRREVDRWGGITKLAEATGLPQPSLSRFFSSASMPRRTTLFRIAEALQLRESAILSKWAA